MCTHCVWFVVDDGKTLKIILLSFNTHVTRCWQRLKHVASVHIKGATSSTPIIGGLVEI